MVTSKQVQPSSNVEMSVSVGPECLLLTNSWVCSYFKTFLHKGYIYCYRQEKKCIQKKNKFTLELYTFIYSFFTQCHD